MSRDNIWNETTDDGALVVLHDGPVHSAFGLTYASYFVLPRSLMQHMPIEWQERFAKLVDDYWSEWDTAADKEYAVQLRGEDGRFISDPLSNYRRPDRELLESLWKGGKE